MRNKLLKIVLCIMLFIAFMPAQLVQANQSNDTTYTITFDANGGSGFMDQEELKNQDSFPINTYTKEGFYFKGWSKNKNATSPEIADGGLFQENSNQTYYAVWSKTAKAITFNPQKGVSTLPKLYLDQGDSVLLPDVAGRVYLDGAEFNGWTTKVGGLTEYGNRAYFTKNDNKEITLYANWRLNSLNEGGMNPKLANTVQWVKGINPPKDSDWLKYTEDSFYVPWQRKFGFYDIYQFDTWLCFAAAAGNGIHYMHEQNQEYLNRYYRLNKDKAIAPYYYENESKSDIFNVFQEGLKDHKGGKSQLAFAWYMNGISGHEGGGYFKDVFGNKKGMDYLNQPTMKEFNEYTNKMITEGGVITFSFVNHAYTMWGATYDEQGFVNGIIYTNSGDLNGYNSINAIFYDKISYIDGKPHIKNYSGGWSLVSNLNYSNLKVEDWNDYFLENEEKESKLPKQSIPETVTNTITTAETGVSDENSLKEAVKKDNFNIKLNSNISLKSTVIIEKNGKIDLNGHIITGFDGGSALQIGVDERTYRLDKSKDEKVSENVKVNLLDSSTAKTGKITGGHGGVMTAGGISVKGKNTQFIIESGEISGNTGRVGGLHIDGENANVVMNDGKIINNNAKSQHYGRGGGVYLQRGSFTLNGGEISSNTSDYAGAGIAVNGSSAFLMNGGSISSNTVDYEMGDIIGGGAGIYILAPTASVELKGGTISNNVVNGDNAYAGGVFDRKGATILSGPIQITGNRDSKNTFESNLVLDDQGSTLSTIQVQGSLESNGKKAKVGVQFRNQQTGNTVTSKRRSTVSYANYFTSDVPQYEVKSGGMIEAKDAFYSMQLEHPTFALQYGAATSILGKVFKNGELHRQGTLALEFENKKVVNGMLTEEGYELPISPISGELGLKIGINKVKAVWKDGTKTIEKEFELYLYPSIIENNEIQWSNTSDRMEGDGKKVEAKIIDNAIAINDLGKVELYVENAHHQEVGEYIASVVELSGEKAGYYTISSNTPTTYWQKAYQIKPGDGTAIRIISTPQEQIIARGGTATFDIKILQGSGNVVGGVVNLETKEGNILATSAISTNGTTQIQYEDTGILQDGINNLQLVYYSNARSKQASAPVIINVNSKQLEKLTFDGTLSASSVYGKTYNELMIEATKKPIDSKGSTVNGSWRWNVSDLTKKPSVSDQQEIEVIFVPETNANKYARLVKKVDPKIEKADAGIPAFPEAELKTHDTIIIKENPNTTTGVQAIYSNDNGKTWQTSPVFSGLKASTTYSFKKKYPETENYVESKETATQRIATTAKTSQNDLKVNEKPVATSEYGKKVSEITINGGTVVHNGQTVPGKWMWSGNKDVNEVLNVGTHENYQVTFIPNDKALGSISTSIAITITKATQHMPSNVVTALGGIGVDFIQIQPIASPYGTKTLYKIDETNALRSRRRMVNQWQETPLFEGLKKGTNYTISAKFEENSNYKDSDLMTLQVSTLNENPKPVYSILIDDLNKNYMYGNTITLNTTVYANGILLNDGVVKVYEKGKEQDVLATKQIVNGKATLTIDTKTKKLQAGQLHELIFEYEPTSKTVSEKITKGLTIQLEQKEIGLSWENITDRKENDGKMVTAKATGLLNSDEVEIEVVNGNAQAAGTYTAKAKKIKGKDAGWYRFGNNVMQDYIIVKDGETPPVPKPPVEDKFTIAVSAQPSNVVYGEDLSYRVRVTNNGITATDGMIKLFKGTTRSKNELVSAPLSGENTVVTYQTGSKVLEPATHGLVLVYEKDGKQMASLDVAVTINKKPLTLTWKNEKDRFVGDGKVVTATINGLNAGDNVSVLVENGDVTTAGTHTVTAKLTGEDAKWYQINGESSIQVQIQEKEQPPLPPTPPEKPDGGEEKPPVNPEPEKPANQAPVIVGDNLVLTVGDLFDPLKAVTASDAEDGVIPITKEHIIKNDVNMNQPGTYRVTYKVIDKQGASTEKTILVIVNPKIEGDVSLPIIEAKDIEIFVGEVFDPLKGVKASDKVDGEIVLTKENVILNTVDTSKAGIYEVTYRVVNKKGMASVKTIKVVVKEKQNIKPELPSKPETPQFDTNQNQIENDNKVPTGDNSQLLLWISLSIVSIILMGYSIYKRKTLKNKNEY